jgi:hypothetical protein
MGKRQEFHGSAQNLLRIRAAFGEPAFELEPKTWTVGGILMSQQSIFDLPLCPCGSSPGIMETDVVLWCLCPLTVFEGGNLAEAAVKYQDWLAAPANPGEGAHAD